MSALNTTTIWMGGPDHGQRSTLHPMTTPPPPHPTTHPLALGSAIRQVIARAQEGGAPAVVDRPRSPGGQFQTVISEELIERMRQALLGGAPPAYAAPYAGISRDTYHRWLREALRPDADPLLVKFREVCEQAVAEWAVGQSATITRAAREDYRAAQFMLERRLPSEFGRRERVDLGNADGQPFKVLAGHVDLSKLSDEELEVLRALHEKAQPEPADPGGDVIDMPARRRSA